MYKRQVKDSSSPETTRLTLEEEEVLDASIPEDESSDQANARFDNHQLYQKLKIQILSGGFLGLFCCLLVGGAFVCLLYTSRCV